MIFHSIPPHNKISTQHHLKCTMKVIDLTSLSVDCQKVSQPYSDRRDFTSFILRHGRKSNTNIYIQAVYPAVQGCLIQTLASLCAPTSREDTSSVISMDLLGLIPPCSPLFFLGNLLVRALERPIRLQTPQRTTLCFLFNSVFLKLCWGITWTHVAYISVETPACMGFF